MNYRELLNKQEEIRLRHLSRIDANEDNPEEEEDNGAGHGNTSLPYGLAKGEGIDTTGMKPKQVWEALEGYGYSAASAYHGLKQGKHGKELKSESHNKSDKPKKPKVQIDTDHFPKQFQKTQAKANLKILCDELNKSDMNPDIAELISLAGSSKTLGALKDNLKIRFSDSINKFAFSKQVFMFGDKMLGTPVSATLTVPKLKNLKGEDLQSAVASQIHEITHMMDFAAGGGIDFSDNVSTDHKKLLHKAKERPISKEAEKFMEDFNNQVKEKRAALKPWYESQRAEIDAKYGGKPKFGDPKYNLWVDETNKVIKEYNKKMVNCLETPGGQLGNMYDAISGGALKDAGKTVMGHGKKYFKHTSDRVSEMLSIYAEMQFVGGKQLEIFRNDYPDVAKMLDGMYADMVKKVKGT